MKPRAPEGEPSRNEPRLRYLAVLTAVQFVWVALFPRHARRMRLVTRLGPRGVVAYIAVNTAIGFGIRNWVVPALRRQGEGQLDR